jgi:hypothetical protein
MTAEELPNFEGLRKLSAFVDVFLVPHLRPPILVSELVKFRLAAETAQQEHLLPLLVQMRESTPSLLPARSYVVGSEWELLVPVFSTVGPSALLPITGCLSAILNYSIELEKENIRNDRYEFELRKRSWYELTDNKQVMKKGNNSREAYHR